MSSWPRRSGDVRDFGCCDKTLACAGVTTPAEAMRNLRIAASSTPRRLDGSRDMYPPDIADRSLRIVCIETASIHTDVLLPDITGVGPRTGEAGRRSGPGRLR